MRLHPFDNQVQAVFEEFWQPIVMLNGEWDLEQVKRELYDYRQVMSRVSEVYEYITHGRISKPNTDPAIVIAEVTNELIREATAKGV